MLSVNPKPTFSNGSMADTLEVIKIDLVSEYERLGKINIGEWLRRHPGHRNELLDFWVCLKAAHGSSIQESEATRPIESSEIQIYEQSIRDACLAVTLGAEWLLPSSNPGAEPLEALATELEAIRRKTLSPTKASLAFKKAVVCTWVVDRLQQSRPSVTRLATQKVTYLLEHALSLSLFVDHNRKPLGPYDRNMKYRDAEPIACKKGWLEVSGTTLKASADLSELKRFLPRYVRSEQLAQRVVQSLTCFSDEQLETLATIHAVTRQLNSQSRRATVEDVLGELAEIDEWKSKLSRPNFSYESVHDALLFLVKLRLVRGEVPFK